MRNSRANAHRRLLGRGVGVEDLLPTIRYLLATPSVTGQMIALGLVGQHLAWRTGPEE